MKIKILIIENQIIQFRMIRDLLPKERFTCVLDESDYMDFMEALFVMLGPTGEMEDYQIHCQRKVSDKIQTLNPDLIIMDYKLCGSSDAKNGIECAEMIMGSYHTLKPCPILFLSRVVENERQRTEAYNMFKDKYKGHVDWINKGFFGSRVLESSYGPRITTALDNLWNSSIKKSVMDALEDLKVKESYNYPLKQALKKLYSFIDEGGNIGRISDTIINLLLQKQKVVFFDKEEEEEFTNFVDTL